MHRLPRESMRLFLLDECPESVGREERAAEEAKVVCVCDLHP